MKILKVFLVGLILLMTIHISDVVAVGHLTVQSYSFSQPILKPDMNLSTTVNVKNNGVTSEGFVLVMALYNSNKILENIITAQYTTAGGATTAASLIMALPSKVNGYNVKVFLWNNLSNANPQNEPFLICSLDDITSTSYATWWRQLNMACSEEVAIARKGGEAAQMVWAFAVSPTNPKNLFVGTDTAGVWKSIDAGASWKISSNGLNVAGTVDIAYDPDNENIAYVAASPNNSSNLHTDHTGIYKTIDGGESWTLVKHTHFNRIMTNKVIKFGAFNVNGIRTLYVGTHQDGIWKSEDRGATWSSLGRNTDTIIDLYVNGTTIIEASLESGVMVSTDGGVSWVAKNGFASGTTKVTSIAVNPKDSQNWFAIENNTSPGKVYKSINAGTTWTDLNVPTTSTSGGFKFYKLLFGAAPSSGNPILYLGLNASINSLRKSTTLGTSWSIPILNNSTSYFKSNTGWFAEPIAVHPTDPNIVWAPFDTSIYKSTDGGTNFIPSGSGFSGFRASDFLFDKYNSGNTYIALLDRGVTKSVDVGITSNYPAFYNLTEDTTNNIRYSSQKTVHSIVRDPANSQHLIINVGDWGANVILKQSFDGGNSFSSIAGTENKTHQFMAYHPQNNSIIYAGKNYSANGGSTWSILSKSISAVSPFNGDVVWAKEGDYIYKSTDRGQTWGSALNSTPIYGMQRLLADNMVPNRVWVGTYESGIYVLDGNIVTRRGTAEGLIRNVNNVLGIYDIAQDPKDGLNLVAGGVDNKGYAPTAGLFESSDGGNTWRVVSGMPGIRDIWRVEFHPTLSHVYVGTSSGTWIYDYSLNSGSGMKIPEYSSATLTSTRDSYIQVGDTTSDYDASDPYNLRLKNAGGTGDWKTFIQFDLSNMQGTPIEVILQLKCSGIQTSPQTVQAYEVANYTWPNASNDSSMNSSNAPTVGAAIQGATAIVNSAGSTVNINVSSFIESQYISGKKVVNIALLVPTATGKYVLFNSKEDNAKAPKLIVRYK